MLLLVMMLLRAIETWKKKIFLVLLGRCLNRGRNVNELVVINRLIIDKRKKTEQDKEKLGLWNISNKSLANSTREFKKWLPIRVLSTLGRNSNIRHCYEGQSLVGRCIEECKFNVKSAMNPRSCKLTAHFTAGWQVLF